MLAKADADRILGALTAARDRIAAAMYTVDTHPVRARLDAGTFTGETDRVKRGLAGDVDRSWARFGALRDLIERAIGLRHGGRSGEAELESLLMMSVVGLDADGVPIDEAGTTPAATTVRLSDFAAQTEAGCTAVLEQLARVEKSQAALTMEYARATAAVEEVGALAASLGEPAAADPLRAAAAEIEALDLTDPLGAAPSATLAGAARKRFDALVSECARAKDALAAVVATRDGYPARRAALATLIDEVEAAERAAGEAHIRATEKILAPGLGPVPTGATVLRGRLKQLDDTAAATLWRRLTGNLSTMEGLTRDALARAQEARANADGLVARRDELRGRLEAYRAKAVARHLAENVLLGPVYMKAHTVLFTAPCDLRAATRAVYEYQTNLARLLKATDMRRSDG
jgi:hypothetical protein